MTENPEQKIEKSPAVEGNKAETVNQGEPQEVKEIEKDNWEFKFDSDTAAYCLVQLKCCLLLINSLKGKFEILEKLLI